ncbi:hypothetical protein E3J62_10775 [candidate division TA06 bacterium]|uniref:Uncharacterized protein n=1 Tax=candidate division TA06 bacterium TaxID=2250710 RepID=A0A523UP42_UNCT6|nr:MAG: hypothetical protein E3J62_10775 [candidate division TA06 bacterium]
MGQTNGKKRKLGVKGIVILASIGGLVVFFVMVLPFVLILRSPIQVETKSPPRRTVETKPKRAPQPEPIPFERRVEQEVDRAIPGPVTVKVDGGMVKVVYSKKSIWNTTALLWDVARNTCKVCKILFEHPEVQSVWISVTTLFTDKDGLNQREEVAATIVFTRETASKVSWRKLQLDTVPMNAYHLVFDVADDYYLHPVVVRGLASEK